MNQQKLMYKAGEKSLEFIPAEAEFAVFGAGRTVCQSLQAFYDNNLHKKYKVVCGSRGTEDFAKNLGIRIENIDVLKGKSYVYIDGADQIDPDKNIIKGGLKIQRDKNGRSVYVCGGDPGIEGCMKREKELAYNAEKFIIIADDSKLVKFLGQNDYPFPVEFKQEFINDAAVLLCNLGFPNSKTRYFEIQSKPKPKYRLFETENKGNIVDVWLENVRHDFLEIEKKLEGRPKIISTGLFAVRKPETIIIASEKGINVW